MSKTRSLDKSTDWNLLLMICVAFGMAGLVSMLFGVRMNSSQNIARFAIGAAMLAFSIFVLFWDIHKRWTYYRTPGSSS